MAAPPSPNWAVRYAKSHALAERARQIIPGGGHLSGRPLVDDRTTPSYFDRAEGCRIWDVDGHVYIDYLMAFGAHLLGYAVPAIDEAAWAQVRRGRLVSLNHPLHVAFIEALLPLFPGAEMGVFFKTGSEATTAALRIARRFTRRRAVARCGYHGWHDWCLPLEDFVPVGLAEQVHEFRAREPDTLEALFAQHPGSIAAVIVAPEMVTPYEPRIFHELCRITRSHGALFVMDEVKTGLRIAPNSVAERAGLIPDLLTVSKALGNGWPVAALLGRREVMASGAGMHYSATFHGDTAGMAAALASLAWIKEHGVQLHVETLGQSLIEGLSERARRHGIAAVAYGEPLPAMPFLRFSHPNAAINAELSQTFYRSILGRGILLHPRHMWFISHAHTPADIAETLDAADQAFADAARALGKDDERPEPLRPAPQQGR